MPKRILAPLFLSQIFAAGVMAQDATQAAEFGRFSGGQIEAITKQPRALSGSLSIMRSDSTLGSGLNRYEATLGGTVVPDRLWFFASSQHQDGFRAATPAPEIQQRDFDRATFLKSVAQLGDRHVLDTAFSTGPSSFLSLRYQAAVSSNMFFSGSFSRDAATRPPTAFSVLGQ
jgi:hypothetical protein